MAEQPNPPGAEAQDSPAAEPPERRNLVILAVMALAVIGALVAAAMVAAG
ncbi:hypothetical protein [Nocardia huaxiensis]|uniref:Uncharacterized protein n=1 Tax=Nocardia huaxiensis TaxID=2755382 RepID=A0A7D6V7H5_9NOCA|nr:hypothetical protein [Nocardia huaxiensis]QLY29532.1 hypothetical protein H0264_30420 [Nocardia huaxiensis]UFS96909.1 hypothetical protein LPY97_02965 [Nocardia huaxiensis]